MPFTTTRLDDESVGRLVTVYKKSIDRLLDSFDASTDFSRSQRLALIAQVDSEMKNLGVATAKWLDKELPAAYVAGMKDAISGLEDVNGYTKFYHGAGGIGFGNLKGDELGSGFYITSDKKVAKEFGGKISTTYLNIFDPNQVLRINSDADLDKLVNAAIRKYPLKPYNEAINKYAQDQGYKAIMATSKFDELGGMNILDRSLLSTTPRLPVKTLFTQPNKLQISALVDDASKSFGDALTLVGRNVRSITTQAFQREIRARIAEGVVTAETRKQIVAGVKQQLRDRGLTALVDRGGKNWTLDRYADMLARTKLREARNTGLGSKMLENGQDLVQVSINGSDHEACADWEGKILSMTGKTDGFDTVDQATSDGLFHPNCKHTVNPIEPKLAERTFGWDIDNATYKQGIIED